MSAFGDFQKAVISGAGKLAKSTFKDFVKQAKDDAGDFLKQTEDDLRTWTQQLAGGALKKDEFKELVEGRKAVAELHALTQAGIAQIQLDKFRDALVDLVINAAFKAFVP
jgi:hypothetical protein